jgi:hypothetical protein
VQIPVQLPDSLSSCALKEFDHFPVHAHSTGTLANFGTQLFKCRNPLPCHVCVNQKLALQYHFWFTVSLFNGGFWTFLKRVLLERDSPNAGVGLWDSPRVPVDCLATLQFPKKIELKRYSAVISRIRIQELGLHSLPRQPAPFAGLEVVGHLQGAHSPPGSGFQDSWLRFDISSASLGPKHALHVSEVGAKDWRSRPFSTSMAYTYCLVQRLLKDLGFRVEGLG